MITAKQQAAEQGLVESQFNLGMGYFKRDGVPEDDSQAAVWFRKAAEQAMPVRITFLVVNTKEAREFYRIVHRE